MDWITDLKEAFVHTAIHIVFGVSGEGEGKWGTGFRQKHSIFYLTSISEEEEQTSIFLIYI